MIEREPEDYPVGEGPLYEPFREIAKSLVPLFAPGELRFDSWWSLGSDFAATNFVDVHCDLSVAANEIWGWKKEGGARMSKAFSSQDLRVLGIGLLVLAEDMEREND